MNSFELNYREKEEAIEAISLSSKVCKKCQLSEERLNVVPGSGDFDSKIIIIGEAPGAQEDKEGVPFVGRSGKKLDTWLNRINLTRKDVFITNIVKCRPPKNRNPEFIEIKACSYFLKQQIKIIKPKIIITVGKFASQSILRTEDPISSLRGKFFNKNGYSIFPIYHPAYILRNQSKEEIVFKDFDLLKEKL